LFALVVLPVLAVAKLAIPNDAFGRIEGALDFCAQADPPSASKYQEKKKLLTQGATEKEVAEARESQEYKDGYRQSTDEYTAKPKDEALKACRAAVEEKK
jgi:hypothetical protein